MTTTRGWNARRIGQREATPKGRHLRIATPECLAGMRTLLTSMPRSVRTCASVTLGVCPPNNRITDNWLSHQKSNSVGIAHDCTFVGGIAPAAGKTGLPDSPPQNFEAITIKNCGRTTRPPSYVMQHVLAKDKACACIYFLVDGVMGGSVCPANRTTPPEPGSGEPSPSTT